jgi:hypothetical protein
MSNIINFDAQQNSTLDSTIAQALNNFEAGANLPQNQQQQSQDQSQEGHHKQYHSRNDHRYNQVPIDPSIGDDLSSSSGKNDDDSVTQELAQAAVQQSSNVKRFKQEAHHHHSQQSQRNNDPNKVTKPRVNKPGQKFGAKKKSWVWNWFTQDPIDWNIATCVVCNRPIKRLDSDKGSPKKLGEHLKTHKVNQLTPTEKRPDLILGNSEASLSNQPTGTSTAGGTGTNSSVSAESARHYFNTINTTPATFKQHEAQQSGGGSSSSSINTDNNNNSKDAADYDKQDFDLSPYSPSKFQKHLMKFLIDNKLPLSIVKTHSFRELVHTLKPEVLSDINELNNLYSSLLDIIGPGKSDDSDDVAADVNNNQNVDVDHHDNVDDQLHNSTSGWV